MAKKKILIIDDEKDLCLGMKLNLERTGEYEVTMAYSGGEGLEIAKEAEFDLVITDFKMPGMNGDAVLDALKEMRPHLPVVLLSIYHDDSSTITSSVKSKADALVSKPIDKKKLYKIVKDTLAKRGQGSSNL